MLRDRTQSSTHFVLLSLVQFVNKSQFCSPARMLPDENAFVRLTMRLAGLFTRLSLMGSGILIAILIGGDRLCFQLARQAEGKNHVEVFVE